MRKLIINLQKFRYIPTQYFYTTKAAKFEMSKANGGVKLTV